METDPDVWAEIVDNYRNEENKKNQSEIEEEENELDLKLKPLSDKLAQETSDNSSPKKRRFYKTKKRKDYARLLDESTELSNEVMLEQIKNTQDIVLKSPLAKSAKESVCKKYAQLVREPCRELRPPLSKLFSRNLKEMKSENDPETPTDVTSDPEPQDDQYSFDNSESYEYSAYDFTNDDTDNEQLSHGYSFRGSNKKFRKTTPKNGDKSPNVDEKSILTDIESDFKPTVFATRTYARKSEPFH